MEDVGDAFGRDLTEEQKDLRCRASAVLATMLQVPAHMDGRRMQGARASR